MPRKIKLMAVGLILCMTVVLNSCQGGDRLSLHESPLYGPAAPTARQSVLQPGQGEPFSSMDLEVSDAVIVEGKRLYGWYNCAGCHFNGGGGIGPALMNDDWTYGKEPQNIADTIINGRPQGMPAYGGRIPAAHIGPIVVYVRSLSGLGTDKTTPTPYPRTKKDQKTTEEMKKEQPGVEKMSHQEP
jgi:cytochrome c oxidase cbb3-type subunit III